VLQPAARLFYLLSGRAHGGLRGALPPFRATASLKKKPVRAFARTGC
jgi:hypothetical protein